MKIVENMTSTAQHHKQSLKECVPPAAFHDKVLDQVFLMLRNDKAVAFLDKGVF